jgi:hypothetical protein
MSAKVDRSPKLCDSRNLLETLDPHLGLAKIITAITLDIDKIQGLILKAAFNCT